MQVDAMADVRADPLGVESEAIAAERGGYHGIGLPETRSDVFVAATLAARATSRITVQTGIAVAFARNPMSVAVQANDLQLVAGGRFRLGLGSQVRAHIERRFGMPWSRPAERMEEFVAAVRAVWARWETGERLRVEGEFYRHTLMTEFFDPGPNPHGAPPVLIAAVGPRMTAVAGRVGDGLLCHSLTSPAYLRDVTLPTVRAARGGSLDGFAVSQPVLVSLGDGPDDRARADAAVRRQIAFYASTPSYRTVLDHHGWGALHEELNRLSRRQAWDEMAEVIDDDVLDTFAVGGTPEQVAATIADRYGDLLDRVALYSPEPVDPALHDETARLLRVHSGDRDST